MSVEVRDGGLNWRARIDTSGLEQDAKRIEEQFQKINAKQKQAEQDLRAAVGKNLQNVTRAAREEFAALSPEVQKTQAFLATLSHEIRNVAAAEKNLSAAFKQGKISQEQYATTSAALTNERKRIAEVIRQETAAIAANERMSRMQTGSIDQKRAKLQQLTTQWNALSAAERNNARTGGILRKQINSLDREVSNLDRSMRSARGGGMILNQVLMATAGIFTLTQGTRLIRDIIAVRGEIEQLEVAFSTMLGSKEKADQLMAEIVEVATTTPFKLTEVADATKQLLAYGFAQKEIKPELIAIGNIASGVGATFQEVAYAYGTLKTQGRAFARDIRQFTTRGIPIVAELAKQFNVTESEIGNMVSAGKIGFPEVQKAFQNMTGAGGMFFNLMEKRSKTVTGEIAKLQDRIQLMFNEIGKGNDGLIKSGISGVSFLVENYQAIIDAIKTLVVTYGTYRAGLALNTVFQNASGASAISFSRILAVVRLAQMRLNAVILANPYAIAATALGLLVSSLYFFSKEVKEAESLQTKLNRANEATNKLVDDQSGKITQLVGVLKNHSVAESVRLDAYNELKAISPDIVAGLSFEESKTKDLTKAVYDYIDSIREKARSENLMSEGVKIATERAAIEEKLIQAQQRLNTEREKGEQKIFDGTAQSGQSNIQRAEREVKIIQDQLKSIAKAEKTINDEIAEGYDDSETGIKRRIEHLKSLQSSYGKTTEKYKEYEDQISEISKLLTEDKGKGETQDKAFFEKIVKENTEGLEALDISAEDFKAQAKVYKDKIEEAKKNLELFDIKDKKTTEKPDKDKTGDELIKAREKVLNEIDKLEIKAQAKSFARNEQEIKEAQRKYKALRTAAKEAGFEADAGVLERIDRAEEKETGNLRYRQETEALKDELKARKDLYEDYEQHIADFGLQSANKKYESELDITKKYIDRVQDEYQKILNIAPDDRTGAQTERLNLLIEELDKEKKANEKQYEDLLKSIESFQTKKTLLYEKYILDRNKLIENGDTHLLESLEETYNKDLAALQESSNKKTKEYRRYLQGIATMSAKAAKEGIASIKASLKQDLDRGLIDETEYRRTLDLILKAEEELQSISIDNILKIAGAIGTLGNSLVKLGESVGKSSISDMGAALSGLAGGMNSLMTSFDKEASKIDVVVSGINGLVQMIDMLASAAAKRNAEEARYYNAVIGYQNDYNLSLQEQIRLQSIMAESVFLTDYEGRITDGLKAISEADKEYQKALDKLSEGMAISGQKNKIDWGNVGTGIASGAATGAALGLIGGPLAPITSAIGALIGGAIGGLAGAFGGKKKVDNLVPLLEEYPGLVEQTENGLLKVNEEIAKALLANNVLSEETKGLVQDVLNWGEAIEEAREQIKGVISELAGSLGGDLRNVFVEAFENGEDAAMKMGQTVEKVLEGILGQLIFNKVFADTFEALEKDMAKSMDIGGDQTWIDDFSKFFNEMDKKGEEFNQSMNEAQKAGKSSGFNLFEPDEQQKKQATGLTAAIRKEMTSAEASELSGLFRGFYDLTKIGNNTAYTHMKLGQQQADSLIAIQLNTANTVGRLDLAVVELKIIAKNTKGGQSGRGLGT